MDDKEHDSEQSPPRKPYTAPAIVEHAEFETLALQCGKTDVEFDCYAGGGFSAS